MLVKMLLIVNDPLTFNETPVGESSEYLFAIDLVRLVTAYHSKWHLVLDD